MDSWPPETLTERLADLLGRSSDALAASLARLVEVDAELRILVEISAQRPWSGEEADRYYLLAREERKAHGRYLASRDWFDGVRRRIRQRAARLESRAK
jgi:hypothetical protein